jgi:emp24/gp25L/p24 family/GOLD
VVLALIHCATGLVVDVGAYGREFCFNRDAHEGESISLRYAVHRPRGSTVRVYARPVAGEGQVRTLFDKGSASDGFVDFAAPHTGTFKVCIAASTTASFVTSVSIAILVKGHDIMLDDALSRNEVHGANEVAYAVRGVVQQILYRQDSFREAVWRHDVAMYESGRNAMRAASLLAALVAFLSILQVVYVRHLLVSNKSRRSGSFRRTV